MSGRKTAPQGAHDFITAAEGRAIQADFWADGVFAMAMTALYGPDADPCGGAAVRTFGACRYAVPQAETARRIRDAWHFVAAVAAVPEGEVRDFAERCAGAPRSAAARMKGFAERCHLPQRAAGYLPVLAAGEAGCAPGFFECRDRLLASAGPEAADIPSVMQKALGTAKSAQALWRLVRLCRKGAPDFVIAGGLRMLAEYGAMRHDSRMMVGADAARFRELYGIGPDGARHDGPCECGDLELMGLARGASGEASPGGGELPDGLPRWRPAPRPNFLMLEAGTAVYDAAERRYLRDAGGRVALFPGSAAAAEAARLNAEAGLMEAAS